MQYIIHYKTIRYDRKHNNPVRCSNINWNMSKLLCLLSIPAFEFELLKASNMLIVINIEMSNASSTLLHFYIETELPNASITSLCFWNWTACQMLQLFAKDSLMLTCWMLQLCCLRLKLNCPMSQLLCLTFKFNSQPNQLCCLHLKMRCHMSRLLLLLLNCGMTQLLTCWYWSVGYTSYFVYS